jgi:hypothetical protein
MVAALASGRNPTQRLCNSIAQTIAVFAVPLFFITGIDMRRITYCFKCRAAFDGEELVCQQFTELNQDKCPGECLAASECCFYLPNDSRCLQCNFCPYWRDREVEDEKNMQ